MESVKKISGLLIFEGILFIILGSLAIIMPGISTLGIEILIGWLFLVGGVIQLVRSFRWIKAKGFFFSLITALLAIALGVLLLVYPLRGVLTLTIVLAAFFLADGISKVIVSLQLRQAKNWGWIFFNGLISIAMAVIIWMGWPGTAAWVIGLLVGINLIFFGFALLSMGFAARKGGAAPMMMGAGGSSA